MWLDYVPLDTGRRSALCSLALMTGRSKTTYLYMYLSLMVLLDMTRYMNTLHIQD